MRQLQESWASFFFRLGTAFSLVRVPEEMGPSKVEIKSDKQALQDDWKEVGDSIRSLWE